MKQLFQWFTSRRFTQGRSRREGVAAARPISFRPSLEGLENRLCLSTTIDATALTYHGGTLDGVAFDTTQAQTLNLSTGAHTLAQKGGSVTFSVAADGTVSYDPSENQVLSGTGTSTLTVLGDTVNVDATQLNNTLISVAFDFQKNFSTQAAFGLTVLPGASATLSGGSGEPGSVSFSVGSNGTVSYSSTLGTDGVLSGAGTSTLTVNGVTATIDATPLNGSIGTVEINFQTNFSTATPFQVTLLPGNSQDISEGFGEPGLVHFNLAPNGVVTYASALATSGVLSGSGTNTLKVNGTTVTIDAHALSEGVVEVDVQKNVTATSPFQVTLLPGNNHTIRGESGTPGTVQFNVATTGAVSFASSWSGVLAVGSTPSTLVVNGVTVTIDSPNLTVPQTWSLDEVLPFTTGTPFTVTVLPGSGHFVENPQDGLSEVIFSILNNGTFSYNKNLGALSILSGTGTSTLTINPETIQVDATALAQQGISTFTLAGVGTFSTAAVQTVSMLPGWQIFQSTGPQFDFKAEVVDGTSGLTDTVDYDPSLGNILSGRGTNKLVVT